MRKFNFARFFVPFAIFALGACAPAVQHGPWVYSGTSGGFRVGAAGVQEDNADYPGLSVSIDGTLRAGFVPEDSTAPAFSAGLQTSLFALILASGLEDPKNIVDLFAADVYVAIPSSSRYAMSAGVAASTWHAMPYFQIGSKKPSDGWYVTNAFLLVDAGGCCDIDFPRFFWLPSYTRVFDDPRSRATHLSFGLGLGKSGDRMIYALTAGVGMEFFGSAARVR